ncbi:MAG: tetratricopeptide repeat protein, partial [Chitinophagales bacterium]
TDYTIVNPRNLSVELQNELCFRCHLQGVNVLHDGASFFDFKPGDYIRDHWNIFLPAFDGKNDQFLMASQADRLIQSRCFIESKQISCITCHNPHITVKQTPVAQFNAPCMQCHNTKGCTETIAARNLLNNNCSGCHMPKSGSIDIPHVSISDHKIQIPGKEKEKAEGKFTGLKAITDLNASPLTMAKGYLQYYEVFTHQPVMLDSARMWLNKVKNKDDAYWRACIHLHYLLGNFNQIVQDAELIQQADKLDAWTYYRIGESYLALAVYPQAITYFQKATGVLPYNLDFNLKLGSAYFLANNTAEAEKIFLFIVNENPKYERAWMNLGSIYALKGNYTEAEAAYKKAIDLDPDYLQARLSLTDLYTKTRQKQKAKAMLDYLLLFHAENTFVKQMQMEINRL